MNIEQIALSKYPGNTKIAKAQREVYIETIKNNHIISDALNIGFTPISESEFKELFELDENDKVSDESLFLYSKTVVGCYLLAEEFFENNIKIAELPYNNSLVAIETSIDRGWDASDWRSRVQDIVAEPKISVTFRYINSDNCINFWSCETWKEPKLQVLMNLSYSKLQSYIDLINAKYENDYGVSIKYDLDKWQTNEWFFRMGEIVFKTSIPYTNANGEIKLISNYDIRSSIIQENNIWIGELPKCLNKLIESIK